MSQKDRQSSSIFSSNNGSFFIFSLDTLSTMLNVSDPVAFKSTVQKNFDEIFYAPDVTAQEVSAKIYSFVG
jgi:monomeric isocitrate dehydrogenase